MARRTETWWRRDPKAKACLVSLTVAACLFTAAPGLLGGEPSAAQTRWLAGQLAQTAPSQETVKKIQKFLKVQGYPPGPADGLMGAKTAAAIAAFEKDEGWTVTGRVSDRLLERAAADPVETAPADDRGFLQRIAAAAQPFSLDDIKAPCPHTPAPEDDAIKLQDLGEMKLAFETRKGGEQPGSYTTKKLCLEEALRRVELFYKDGEVSPEDQAAGDIGELRMLLYRSEGSKSDPEIGFDLVVFHKETGAQKFYFAPDGKWLRYRQ